MEPFMMWLKAGLIAGVIFGAPGIFWHIWQFFAAGLYPHERRYVYWYLPLSLLLFFGGVALAFFVIFQLVLSFLIGYTTSLDVEFAPRLNDYMSFAMMLPLGFGLAFQLPIIMLGLHRFGVVTAETFLSQWRIAVLVISFLAMILTPADPYSMIGLAIPLVLLYFFGILLCHYMPKGAGIGSPAIDPQ
jgi:sec-independent protein translocase protein TatC